MTMGPNDPADDPEIAEYDRMADEAFAEIVRRYESGEWDRAELLAFVHRAGDRQPLIREALGILAARLLGEDN